MIEVAISLTAFGLPVKISIHSLLEDAERAIGSMTVIDVFRAFTTAAVALANGASSIVMVRSVEEALALREAGIARSVWASFEVEHRMASISATRPLRSRPSISSARQSSSGRVLGRRVLSRPAMPSGSTRPRWLRQRRPCELSSRDHPIRSPSSPCATTGSSEPRRTNYARPFCAHPEDVDIALDGQRRSRPPLTHLGHRAQPCQSRLSSYRPHAPRSNELSVIAGNCLNSPSRQAEAEKYTKLQRLVRIGLTFYLIPPYATFDTSQGGEGNTISRRFRSSGYDRQSTYS